MPTSSKERTVYIEAQPRKVYIEKKPTSAQRTVRVQ